MDYLLYLACAKRVQINEGKNMIKIGFNQLELNSNFKIYLYTQESKLRLYDLDLHLIGFYPSIKNT